MKLNELSKEKLDILGTLKTDDEIKAFIDNEDIELDMEELDSVSGGAAHGYSCQYCGASFTGQFGALALFSHMGATHPEFVEEI
ncbi:MAG: hypothetical protein J6U16_09205, partial [Ruminococcus sp.]|nr:hypothetical protein [Ruminococcus sp.]